MEFIITEKEKQYLLSCARETITARLERREPFYPQRPADSLSLEKPCGAFVTIHIKDARGNTQLRGCIGRMIGAEALEKTVKIMAAEAAFGDPRFPPLSKNELGSISIEISALSPLEKCPDPRSVKVGVHGVYLIYRGHSGVLLPQVPVEQGWNQDEYLNYINIKAGLPPGSWDDPKAERYVFTAVVFGE
ncbi:MAG: AmmeMemoRadiSam system protein A [Treponema sp.]|nr:AmmeMemoRadiSam system protein A [Treponema sp.]